MRAHGLRIGGESRAQQCRPSLAVLLAVVLGLTSPAGVRLEALGDDGVHRHCTPQEEKQVLLTWRERLLDLKSTGLHEEDIFSILDSWSSSLPVCVFDGVQCDERQKYVTELYLGGRRLEGPLPVELSCFGSLATLDLDNNKLQGTLPPQWSSLLSLSELMVRSNLISGPLPPQYSALSRLTRVDLHDNKLNGQLPAEWSTQTKLHELNLSFNDLTGHMPDTWAGMINLRVLNMHRCGCDASLPVGMLANLTDLVSLRMGGPAGRTGPPIETDMLPSGLEILILDNADLQGKIPATITRLSNLEVLKLPNNPLHGTLPKELSVMTRLYTIDFDDTLGTGTSMSGTLPPEWSLLRRLQRLEIGGSQCSLSGTLPESWTRWSNLERLVVKSCDLTGTLSPSFRHLTALQQINLSGNMLTGTIPGIYSSLQFLDILRLSNNRLTGNLPVDFGAIPHLKELDAHMNRLSGPLPLEFTRMQSLQVLDLRGNHLTGTIPYIWMTEAGFPQIEVLVLSDNRLTGTIPDSIGYMNPNTVKELWIGGQNLTGSIPESLSRLSSLETLSLSHAQLTGTVPAAISSMGATLSNLALNSNNLNGSFPNSYCSLRQLKSFRIDSNLFTGPLKECLDLINLNYSQVSVCSPEAAGLCPECDASASGLQDAASLECSCPHTGNMNGFCGLVPLFLSREGVDAACFTGQECMGTAFHEGPHFTPAPDDGSDSDDGSDNGQKEVPALIFGLVCGALGVLIAVIALWLICIKRQSCLSREASGAESDVELQMAAKGSPNGSTDETAGGNADEGMVVVVDSIPKLARVASISVVLDLEETPGPSADSEPDIHERVRKLASKKGLGIFSSVDKPHGEAVKILELLACGGMARVYKVVWRGAIVAQKVMSLPTDTVSVEKRKKKEHMLAMEAAISASMCHPNVVQTYSYEIVPVYAGTSNNHSSHDRRGASMKTSQNPSMTRRPSMDGSASRGLGSPSSNGNHIVLWEARIIQEFCAGGSLSSALKKGKIDGQLGPGQTPDEEAAISLAKGITAGMQHIHAMKIVHGDLKAGNVLLQPSHEGLMVKVADFGLSTKLEDDQTHISEVRSGTISHMAPELLQAHVNSYAADVYAFGILLYELFSGAKAWSGMSGPAIISAVVLHRRRPIFNPLTPISIVELATRCWDHDPEARPGFGEISESLNHIEGLMKQGLLKRRAVRRCTTTVELSGGYGAGPRLPRVPQRRNTDVGKDQAMDMTDDDAANYIADLQRSGAVSMAGLMKTA